LLEDEDGEAIPVSGDVIGTVLYGFRDRLRLVVLNACEGARTSASSAYSGFAQKVMQAADIPAAIGMQFNISDTAAITFAEEFYGAIAQGKPLEAALSKARLQLCARRNEEWATPILYLRAEDGHILDIQPAKPITPRQGETADLSGHFGMVREAFDDGQLAIFLGLNVNLSGRELLPGWKPGTVLPANVELCDYLRSQYKTSLVGAPLASVAQHLSIRDKTLKRKLYLAFREAFSGNSELPPIYPHLAEIVALSQKRLQESRDPIRRRFLIVTTNYDDCVERAFRAQSELNDYHVITYDLRGEKGEFRHTLVKRGEDVAPVAITSPNDYKGLLDSWPIILKLPGEVESATPNYAVTEDDFFALASRVIHMLPSEVVGKLRSSSHLYLGYRPRDWPLRALLYSIWEGRESLIQSWAVVPDDQDENIDYWKACDVEVIVAGVEDYVSGLQDALK
jgi:hypothetical protein